MKPSKGPTTTTSGKLSLRELFGCFSIQSWPTMFICSGSRAVSVSRPHLHPIYMRSRGRDCYPELRLHQRTAYPCPLFLVLRTVKTALALNALCVKPNPRLHFFNIQKR